MQIKFSVAELLKILQGDLLYSKGLNEGGVLDLQSEKTLEHDSRKPLKGNIFLALKGESFDGHDFLMGAQEAGADLAIVDRRALVGQAVLKMPLLVV